MEDIIWPPQPRVPKVEGYKCFFEYFKHITTLNTAAILLMVTFLEKAFKRPQWKELAVIAFGCFVISLVASVFVMYKFAWLMWHEEEGITPKIRTKFQNFKEKVIYLSSKYGFMIGVISMAIFGIINILYHPKIKIY